MTTQDVRAILVKQIKALEIAIQLLDLDLAEDSEPEKSSVSKSVKTIDSDDNKSTIKAPKPPTCSACGTLGHRKSMTICPLHPKHKA